MSGFKISIDLFCTFFATEDGPIGAETFCQVKLSTTKGSMYEGRMQLHVSFMSVKPQQNACAALRDYTW